MRLGYACLTVGVPDTSLRTCTMKHATPELLKELIEHNLDSLERMLQYNKRMNIRLFRISSDLIPFGSSPVNTLDWPALFGERLRELGRFAQENGMRLSMHPGQYTVINSPDEGVVQRAVEDLIYHAKVLDLMGLERACKIILHIGGVYGDKPAAVSRFVAQYRMLPEQMRRRLVIENDDRLYTAQDVLEIAQETGAPMVFDNLHHEINPSVADRSQTEWISLCGETWKAADGPQKLHYSQQAAGKKPGSHSATIYIQPFLEYARRLPHRNLDVMLEVKDKNLSAVKCIHCTDEAGRIRMLEEEWARYKYLVLERAPECYRKIRQLLRDKGSYPAEAFYVLVEEALEQELQPGHICNALQHVWGYFKQVATPAERGRFQRDLAALAQGTGRLSTTKKWLHRLALKYERNYLLDALYFEL